MLFFRIGALILQQRPFRGRVPRHNVALMSKLVYNEHGDPLKVVTLVEEVVPEPQANELLLKILAAPVNPADINTIQGKYPERPPLPSVPGNEGVAEVLKVGPGVIDLKPGDKVVPLVTGLGTWRSHTIVDKGKVLKVPAQLGVVEAATLTVNPCTAFRMLRDYVTLKSGDTVIQNGANSACGQNVIQMCRTWGVRGVNIIRDRAGVGELKKFLENLGAHYVLTEEELRKTTIFKEGKVKRPQLALNCVGGQSALELLRHLHTNGIMVTYGGMSREPVTIPTSALIFKNISLRGFWMTQWSKMNADKPERFEMFDEIIGMINNNELKAPAHKFVKFDNYKEALMNTMSIKGMAGKKYILQFA